MHSTGRGLQLLRRTAPRWAPTASGTRNPNRIVIPRLSAPPTPAGAAASSSTTLGSGSEYHDNKNIPNETGQFLSRGGADALRRQQQLRSFTAATDAAVEQTWRDSKPHLRRQQQLIREHGVDGAVRETLDPSGGGGFYQQLRARPLDRAILEEIYLGLHGKRVERRLKRGVAWEHWIAKGDGTAPVYTTSRKAQQTFAFGGRIRLAAKATHPQQFPLLLAKGKAASAAAADAASSSSSSSSSPSSPSRRQGRGKRARGAAALPPELLVPEVAFIGRTSSGKSALINAIVNASVAPYGHLQGTTSAVSFFSVADRVVLVDCPGYGYFNPLQTPQLDAEGAVRAMRAYLRAGAKSPAARQRQAVGAAAGDHSNSNSNNNNSSSGSFFRGDEFGDGEGEEEEGRGDSSDMKHAVSSSASSAPSAGPLPPQRRPRQQQQQRNIKRVFLCVPARGMQHLDWEYCRLLEHLGIPFSVVFTKTDAAPIRMLARLADHTRCQLVQYKCCKDLMLTSSLRLAGIDKMQSLIGSVALGEDRMAGASLDFNTIV